MTSKKLPSIKISPDDRKILTKAGFKIGKALNSGEFGVIYHATRTVPNQRKYAHVDDVALDSVTSSVELSDHTEPKEQLIAAKVINIGPKSKMDKKDISREVYMMNRFKHPHMVEVYDMFTVEPAQIVIFMELAEGGDLCDMLAEEKGYLDEGQASSLCRQFYDALRYMHLLGFAHRDIKLENVLLADKARTITKVTDFGFARSVYSDVGKLEIAHTWCGTVDYMPPEMIIDGLKQKGKRSVRSGSKNARDNIESVKTAKLAYDAFKADVWSTGVVLYLLLNDDFPFGGQGRESQMAKMMLAREYVFLNKSLSEDAKEVINLQFEPNPRKRSTMEAMLKHSWFDPSCWKSVDG